MRNLFCFILSLFLVIASGQQVTAQAEKALSFGLNGISDWSTQSPFIDLMKTARPWVGHLPGQWGGVSFEDLMSQGALDASGWPVFLPQDVVALETRVLTDQPTDARYLSGRYHVFFQGQGSMEIGERGRVISKSPGHLVFEYRPGEGSVTISLTATNEADPLRDINIVKEEHLTQFDAGAFFNPLWLDRLGAVNSIRFMDWMLTNDSHVRQWSELPKENDFTFAWRGVPVSVMVRLANELRADPWFTMPHQSTNALIKEFATYVHATLAPNRVAYVEFSNEVWNFLFEQARWSQAQAAARWGDAEDGWMQFYGLRAAQVMKLWTDVYDKDAPTRLKRIVSVHTGWPELEQSILHGALAKETLGWDPVDIFDGYAVTGYFGYELGEAATLKSHLDQAEAHARRAGQDAGLSRVALREYVSQNRFQGVAARAATIVRNGSFQDLTETLWPYHKNVAMRSGLDLYMYEGGTHAAPVGEAIDDTRLSEFLAGFNYSDEMGDLYTDLLTAWSELDAGPFNAFVDVAQPSKWGSWGALRHLSDQNPRWAALRAGGSD